MPLPVLTDLTTASLTEAMFLRVLPVALPVTFDANALAEALRPTADAAVATPFAPIDSNAAFASASVSAVAAAATPFATPTPPLTAP